VSEAVRRLSAPPEDATAAAEGALARLWAAIDSFDERATMAVLSETSRLLGVPAALDAVFAPTFRRLGAEWRLSPRNIAREHFTSTLARAHLVELLPAGDRAQPVCLAFCPAGELHDIGLVMAALTMAAIGFRPIVLGGQTPSASVDLLLGELRPRLILVGAATRRPVLRLFETWRPPTGCVTVAGGGGFRPEDEGRLGARVHLGSYAALPAVAAGA
jgi:methanogenic corrinoid protein MtbC1